MQIGSKYPTWNAQFYFWPKRFVSNDFAFNYVRFYILFVEYKL